MENKAKNYKMIDRRKITGIFSIGSVMASIILLVIIFSSCEIPNEPEEEIVLTPKDSVDIPARGYYLGMLPIPRENQSFDEIYALVTPYVEFCPVWGRPTPFYNLAEDLSGSWGQTFVEQLIRGNGMFPLIHLSFMGAGLTLETPSDMESSSLADPLWREAYKKAALDVVKAIRPLYLSIGNEVNRWYEKYGTDENNPNGFQHYVTLYEDVYDSVKTISPDIQVFCTFAREIVSENREADLTVLKLFQSDKIDLLIFTSYPYAVQGINRPADIPDDYYSKCSTFMPGKQFGFSELGWSSIQAFGGESGQADFLTQITSRLTIDQNINLYMLGWAWLHDLNTNVAIGLIGQDGTEKQAYAVWKALSVLNH